MCNPLSVVGGASTVIAIVSQIQLELALWLWSYS